MALHLQVVTPRGVVVETEANEVSVPGTLGEFGILEGHIPVLSALRAGVLRYSGGAGKSGSIALGGRGYVEIGQNERVVVLCDMSAKAEDIDPDGVKAELAEAKAELDHWAGTTDDADYKLVQAKLDWAEARIALLSK